MQRFFVYLKLYLLTTLMLLGTATAHGKNAQLIEVKIDATVLSNGDVRMMESRTYQFDGSFSYAYRDLLKARVDSITDIRVSDTSGPYQFTESQQPGSYRIQQDTDKTKVTWYYQAQNEQRTFTISYRLKGKLVIGPEWAELTHTFIGKSWNMDSRNVTVNVGFEQPVRSELRTWVRSTVPQLDRMPIQNGVRFTTAGVSEHENLTLRTVFPKGLVPEASINDPQFSLEMAERQELQREQEAATQAYYGKIAIGVGIIIVTASLIIFVWMYRRYGVRPKISPEPAVNVKELTTKYTPAEATYLMQNGLTNTMLIATLFDLARRGFFTIEELEQTSWLEEEVFTVHRTDQTPPPDELKPHELELFDYVCKQLDQGIHRLKKLFSSTGIGITDFTPQWKKTLKRDIASYRWFDEHSKQGRIYAMTIEGILALLGFATTFWAGPWGLLAGFIPTMAFLASISIAHRSEKGRRLYKRLKAYQKMLHEGKLADGLEIPDSLHFVFAVAFSLSKGKMEKLIQELDMSALMSTWLIINTANLTSAANVASSVTSLTSVATSSVAGTGGASAGAAGGGGGGGVG
ncbi:MAG: DUF2207 domain-containing protein [Bacteroidota bacterium]